MNRKNYKHGNFVDAEPNPHVDIKKYKTKDGKDDGKRYKVKDSEMKVSKKKKSRELGSLGGPSPATRVESKPIIIDLSKTKDGSSIFKIVESKAKGGRAGYKGGKSVKKKGGCAIKGKSPILR